jgi:iron complex outermembrane receptor protein
MHKSRFLLHALMSGALALLLGGHAFADEKTYDLSINGATLDLALNEFAAQTGLQIAYFTKSAEGRPAPAVNGRYTAEQALKTLLASSELRFDRLDDRTIAIHSAAPANPATGAVQEQGGAFRVASLEPRDEAPSVAGTPASTSSTTAATVVEPSGEALDEVTVTGTRQQLYSSTVVTSGVLGEKDPLNIPFSISSYTSELARMQAAYTPAQILKNDPSAQNQGNFIGYQNNVVLRGFAASGGGVRRDGLIAQREGDFPIEAYDRVELVKGVAGFLYGFAEPGGIMNYVTKRPTRESFADLNVRFLDGTGAYTHVDTGGPIDDGRFGYRANLVYQDRDDFTHSADLRRFAASLALDAKVSDALLIRFDSSYSTREQPGVLGLPLTSEGREPPEYDPDNLLVPPWARPKWTSWHAGVRADYSLSDDWKIQAQVSRDRLVTHINFGFISSLQPNGDFTQLVFNVNPRSTTRYNETMAQLMALGKVATGPISHELAFGVFRRKEDYEFLSPTGNAMTIVSSNIFDPVFPGRPDIYGGPLAVADAQNATETHVFIGDTLHFGERWQVLAGARHVKVEASLEDNEASETSPSVGVLFKPSEATTLYASYARSLQYGTRSPCEVGPEIANPCELQPPIQAKQYEVGAKARLTSGLDVALAAYRIALPSDYLDPVSRIYGRFGEQVNQGVELTMTGNLRPNLAVVAGLGYLDAKLARNLDTSLNGNRVAAIASTTANLFVNYGVTRVPGLSLNAGVYRVGSRFLDLGNQVPVDGYTRTDLGAQYRFDALPRELTLRLNVNNVFDEFYWEGLGPFGHSYTPGQGRTYVLSAQMQLF